MNLYLNVVTPVLVLGIFIIYMGYRRIKAHKHWTAFNIEFEKDHFLNSKKEEEKIKFEEFLDFLSNQGIESVFEIITGKFENNISFNFLIPNNRKNQVLIKAKTLWKEFIFNENIESKIYWPDSIERGGYFKFGRNSSGEIELGNFFNKILEFSSKLEFGVNSIFQIILKPESKGFNVNARFMFLGNMQFEGETALNLFSEKIKSMNADIKFIKYRNATNANRQILETAFFEPESQYLSLGDVCQIFHFPSKEEIDFITFSDKNISKNDSIKHSEMPDSKKTLIVGSAIESLSDFIANLVLRDMSLGREIILIEKNIRFLEKIFVAMPKEKANNMVILNWEESRNILGFKNLQLEDKSVRTMVISNRLADKKFNFNNKLKIYISLIESANSELLKEILAKNLFENVDVTLIAQSLMSLSKEIKEVLYKDVESAAFLKLSREELDFIEKEFPNLNSQTLKKLDDNTASLLDFEENSNIKFVKFNNIKFDKDISQSVETYSNLIYWSNKKEIDSIISKLV